MRCGCVCVTMSGVAVVVVCLSLRLQTPVCEYAALTLMNESAW